ncbi:hypothetical protein OSB04_008970, partial [Centaurea solstitialis]
MSSLEALLSKLPSFHLHHHSSTVLRGGAATFCGGASEKEVAEEEEDETKDVGECSSSMSYGHQHQHFQHHEVNVSSCMTNN